ncbi:hypothetical protein [Mycobacterium phage WXIN]|nr:hypothetical protein [Mycobacterium phage WXIN]
MRPVEQLHHRRARGAGGSRRTDTNTAANCFAICAPCHLYVESNRTEAQDNGWLVRQGHSPGATPILYRQSQWVLLRDDGSIDEA